MHGKNRVLERKMNNVIKHAGIIDEIEGCHIKVRILQTSACSSCKVASHCNASDSKVKLIDVKTNGIAQWKIGQEVMVSTSGSVAGRALALGFGLPLAILLVTLIAAKLGECSDQTSALLSLFSLIPYYLVLWVKRKKIAQQVSFQIEESK